MLPSDDAELDAMLETSVRESDIDGFMFVVMAALHAERKLDSRHLAHGARLLPGSDCIGVAAFHMTGDVAEHLMDAVRHKRQDEEVLTRMLFIVAAWCQEHRGGVLPEDLITLARMQARAKVMQPFAYYALQALAEQTKDEGLKHILQAREKEIRKRMQERHPSLGNQVSPEQVQKIFEAYGPAYADVSLRHYRGPAIGVVHEKPYTALPTPLPLRRAAARVGRNDPCPCGSGKKHKHCCLDKDQERLMHSSTVAGRTWDELMADPETHLTPVWMERCDAYQVAQFDPKKVPPELLPAYFTRLFGFFEYDRATAAFEKLGYSEALARSWEEAVSYTTQAGRRDLVQRLVAVRPDQAEAEKELAMYTLLLLAEGDPAKILHILDEGTAQVLPMDMESLKGFTLGLLSSRFCGLGILIARGVVPFLPREDAALVYEHLLLARDRLKLPPDDPCEDIIDRLFIETRTDDGKDAAALREAQRKLGDKVKEVGQLKESLDRLQRDLARREKAASAPVVAAPVGVHGEGLLRPAGLLCVLHHALLEVLALLNLDDIRAVSALPAGEMLPAFLRHAGGGEGVDLQAVAREPVVSDGLARIVQRRRVHEMREEIEMVRVIYGVQPHGEQSALYLHVVAGEDPALFGQRIASADRNG